MNKTKFYKALEKYSVSDILLAIARLHVNPSNYLGYSKKSLIEKICYELNQQTTMKNYLLKELKEIKGDKHD